MSLPHSLCKDGVLLCDMGTEARSGVHDAPVDIIGLLKRALAGEQALAEAPPLVIVGLPNVYIEDGVEHWVDARLEHPIRRLPYLVFLERRDVCPDQKPLRTRDVARPRWHGPDKKRRSVMKAATRKRLRG